MALLCIMGKGGHARSIWDALTAEQQASAKFADDLSAYSDDKKVAFILGFGDLKGRRRIIDQQSGCRYRSVVHPTAYVSTTATVGNGVFIGANAYVGPYVTIGDHCIINTHAVIEHDCVVETNVHISVGTTLCGAVQVLRDSFVGAAAVIIPKITMGPYAFVGAGAKVQQNIGANGFLDNHMTTSVLRHSMRQQQMESEPKFYNWCARKPLHVESASILLRISQQCNQYTNNGPVVKQLESWICRQLGLKNAVHMAASGTAALHALISAYNILHDKALRAITQAYTFPSAVLGPLKNSIVVDNDPKHHGPCFAALDGREKEFDIVIVTNPFGCICDLDVYRAWCDAHSKILIFDNAATPCAWTSDDTNVCDLADAAIVSFHETKFFGRGEGGAIICKPSLWPLVNRSVNFGFEFGTTVRRYHIEASNWRMSEFNAAFLLSFLQTALENPALDKYLSCSALMRKLVDNNPHGVRFMFPCAETTVFSGVCLRMPTPVSNSALEQLSKTSGIELKKYYVPLSDRSSAPVAHDMYDHAICLPFHCDFDSTDIEDMMHRFFAACFSEGA